MTNTDDAWEHFGRVDPYHGVLTRDAYTADRFDEQARRDFFQSGEDYVHAVLGVARDHVDPLLRVRHVLDFGCGVGRLTLPLARRADVAVGVDVSTGMLNEARANAKAAGIDNVTFVVSDDELSRVTDTFDLVHTFIVLQHIAPDRGVHIIERMIERLDPDGVGIIHMTYANSSNTPLVRRFVTTAYERVPWVYMLRNAARRQPLRSPQMHMRRYDLNTVFRLLQESGCHEVTIRFTEATHYNFGLYGVIVTFKKRALDTRRFS